MLSVEDNCQYCRYKRRNNRFKCGQFVDAANLFCPRGNVVTLSLIQFPKRWFYPNLAEDNYIVNSVMYQIEEKLTSKKSKAFNY